MAIIEVEHVSKVFPLRRGSSAFFSNGGIRRLFRPEPRRSFTALDDVSFTLEAGHSMGIIGANGSGKSTLLKILAGVTIPSSGDVRIYGRVASLLELGAGFHPLLTGRENIYLNAGILGLSREDTNRVFDQIVEFSGVEDFIDNAVETYSSGMYVRIAFSVAVHSNPDLFLVDEVLSVGDEEFQRKCRVRIGELKEQGKTIVFVSHDLSIVNTLCDHVVLLSKGRMVQRGSSKETIDFYLRQVGRERGIHTMDQGDIEVIVSHGRVSIFHQRHEVSAPAGFYTSMLSMDQWHESTSADWDITERSPNRCVARGRMPRLPLTIIWEIRIENGRVSWSVALECDHEAPIDLIDLRFMLPTAYQRYYYGDASGVFPDIYPSDLNWTVVIPADVVCRDVTALPAADSPLPPAQVSLDTTHPYMRMEWLNTDYIIGSRALSIGARLPQGQNRLSAGRHDLMTVTLDLGMSREQAIAHAEAAKKQRAIVVGALTAVFENGFVRILHHDRELSSFVHLYTSMLIGNLWNGSHDLHWRQPVRSGNRITASGESRRFRYLQHWELEALDDGVAFRVALEVTEPLDVHEYQSSIVLSPEYLHWETALESGDFPPFDPALNDWRHMNRNYALGTWARASGPSLPTVTFEVTTPDPVFRMTALNTGAAENARVLQALRTPDGGTLHFAPGRYVYFEGLIKTAEPGEGKVS